MSQIHAFIEKYLAKFLAKCQIRNPFIEEQREVHVPPVSSEVEKLIPYLQEHDADPIIIGSLAVIKHLKITNDDIQARKFRPTHALEIFVSKHPQTPPEGWQVDTKTSVGFAWISPGGGYVLFSIAGNPSAGGIIYSFKIEKDPESVQMGCPVADVPTLFKMKLNSDKEKDLYDLMCLARRVGMPEDIDNFISNKTEAINVEFLKRWLKIKPNQLEK